MPETLSFPPPLLIETSAALSALCERLRSEEFVTVDTEFLRERTYWPELCVVQLADETEVAVVDTLTPGLDLSALAALLGDPRVVKVFHAARQDVEIFLHRFGAVPTPIFDTQIAAMVAGFGDQAGYEQLVAGLAGGHIDKAHRFSDWSARPLSPAQIAYAVADVTYLRVVYRQLLARLKAGGRCEWVAEEMAALADPATYRPDPETLWRRLKPRSTNRRLLALLRAATAWREREAQRLNIPRQRLLKNECLVEIAASAPTEPEALERVRGVSRGFAHSRSAAGLLTALAAAHALPEEALPALPSGQGVRPSPALVSLLRVLLIAKAEEWHVAPRLLASAEDLDRLASEEAPDIPALAGWRREIFGADALALKEGRIALSATGRHIRLVRPESG